MSNENVPTKSLTALKEEETLNFWREIDAFKKTTEIPHGESFKGEYVFFDGPPFATGTPHYGHLLASAIKDAVPRYYTMKGFRVLRRWGWDCHGLPIENIVEKDLGISGKKQIEEIGLEKFNEHARSKVLTYVGEWKKTVERLARWVEFDNSYKTMDSTFIESVWWGLKELYNQEKIYESVKVLMYCPRCETPLSNAEVAMDNSYKDITDISVYVKFKILDEENTYILAWTTTPWTLPGNVALAVGEEITYARIKIKKEKVEKENSVFDTNSIYVLSKERMETVLKDYEYEIVGEILGKDLVSKKYQPVFDYYQTKETKYKENGWKIYGADFVTTTDGTGVVHIAPAFGEDDLSLAKKNNLPIIHHVDGTGKFKDEVVDFAGQTVKPKDSKEEPNKHQSADIEIIKYLAHNGKLFAKEKIIHSYPHCYRCETPLYYYAIPAWFLEIQSSKEKLLKLNEKINWIPGHLKEGRFKNVMENAPDWNISRNRFWATPLPFWKCNSCNKLDVIGSTGELMNRTDKRIASIYMMRHGESEKNILGIFDDAINGYSLTDMGREQALKAAESLKDKKIDIIYCSPVRRARETAERVAEVLRVPIFVNEDLREINSGKWDGKKMDDESIKAEREDYNKLSLEDFYKAKRGAVGESWEDAELRMKSALDKINSESSGKNVLIISHQGPLIYLEKAIKNLSLSETGELFQKDDFKYAHPTHIYIDLLRNREFDPHRPYIDSFKWACSCGGEYSRISEVIDCWFESASMPYASQHFPFENQDFFKTHFPADFIAEYISQTRTWFYYTHAVSTLLFNEIGFKNVITTGTVLAEDGQKMSKSKNNFPDPWIMFDKYGADAIRFYLLASPLMRSEDLNFAEREVDEIHKKIILRMRNVLSFYDMYKSADVDMRDDSNNILDRWIVERLKKVCVDVTKSMDAYEIDQALKPMMPFVEDLSTWYLRRSRDRMKDEGEDKDLACATLRYVLFRFSQIIAPFMPFLAEEIYLNIRPENSPQSIHFTTWPEAVESIGEKVKEFFVKDTIIEDMEKVREIVSLALEARSKENIKVKQPLESLTLKSEKEIVTNEDYSQLIKDEVNVKKVFFDQDIETALVLDTKITPELKEEGEYRELLRAIQDLRKKKGLTPKDRPKLYIDSDQDISNFVDKFKVQLEKIASLDSILAKKIEGEEISIGDKKIKLELS